MKRSTCTFSRSSVAPPKVVGRGPIRGLSRLLFVGLVPLAFAAAQTDKKLPDGYAGTETCGTCHEDIVKAYAKNPHHILEGEKKRGWEARSCEGCHGPGAKHADSASADDIRNPKKLAAKDSDKACLTCHLNQPTHAGRLTSGHARSAVACVSCHEVHATGDNRLQTKFASVERVNRECASCHTPVWASFQKPHKHRLPENAMSCIDCHNPHGSFLPRQIQTANANEPGCFKCHSDKRGPFVFQHAPVRNEPCTTCHEPHGSVNPRMLTRSEVLYQCLECHSNIQSPSNAGNLGGVPPAFHDLRNARYRNCTMCHQKIHGSNVDKAYRR